MKGICFIPPLFLLTVEGTKIQTRRIMPCQPDDDGLHDHTRFPMSVVSDMQGFWGTSAKDGVYKEFKPKYRVGERVYLKEPYYYIPNAYGKSLYLYRFQVRGVSGSRQHILPTNAKGWSNKLFMPAKAARFFIEITGVRPEKLQDISTEDCIKEGIGKDIDKPQEAYARLFDSINGKGTWDSNPWMWVYDYKLVKKNEL